MRFVIDDKEAFLFADFLSMYLRGIFDDRSQDWRACALRTAEAEAVITNVEVITRAAQDGDWRAAAWFLEHKYPDRWARLEKRADQDGKGEIRILINNKVQP